MIVIAVDPGRGTGLARWNLYQDARPTSMEVFSRVQVGAIVQKWMPPARAVTVICERYTMNNKLKSAQPDALMISGAIEFLADRPHTVLVWQLVADAKKMIKDALLKKLGLYQSTKDGHANDAMRHMLLWLARTHPERYASLIDM